MEKSQMKPARPDRTEERKTMPARMTAGLIISIRDYVKKMDELISDSEAIGSCDS